MAQDRIPTSRFSRSARIGGAAAGEAVKRLGTRAANLTRSGERAEAALERRDIEAAERIVAVLGTMKGAAMKLGQVLSFLDIGLVPEEHREEFQRKLAALRDSAPNVSFGEMRRVIEEELEAPLEDVFEEFDPEAIAAASIGQVYRATLPGGRRVAVKVQYPGVADAVRSDMKNLGMILRVLKTVAPGLDSRAVGEEIASRIEEELDYELEAQNARALARAYKGHPFIFVPGVVTRLSRERVIVTDLVEGRRFEEVRELPQSERDRYGEIIFRFYLGTSYRHLMFSGDPHPGNALLLDDGRVAFIDFGLFKRQQREVLEAEKAAFRAAIAGDAEGLLRGFHAAGFFSDPSRFDAEVVLEVMLDATGWFLTDREIEISSEVAATVAAQLGDPRRSRHFDSMRHQTLPPQHLFGRRVELLTVAVLGQLRARANWFRIASEWIYDAEPVTELGRLEAEFYAGREPADVGAGG